MKITSKSVHGFNFYSDLCDRKALKKHKSCDRFVMLCFPVSLYRLRESAGHSASIDTKTKMVGCVPATLNQIEKHNKIEFCYVISRLA